MDDVGCAGSEMSLADCSHRGWGKNSCGHNKDAGVICAGDIPATTKSQTKDITRTTKHEAHDSTTSINNEMNSCPAFA
ncbi:galectin-3-binding protein-like [Amphiura filiformis]|uniref:galectin-3-binding protein-like n=1 Tax=Amphiura filiformis TaxID=82378 RepID=UPI003B226315